MVIMMNGMRMTGCYGYGVCHVEGERTWNGNEGMVRCKNMRRLWRV